MTGTVVPGTIQQDGDGINFGVSDRDCGSARAPVSCAGIVPDPGIGGEPDFGDVLDMVERGCWALLDDVTGAKAG